LVHFLNFSIKFNLLDQLHSSLLIPFNIYLSVKGCILVCCHLKIENHIGEFLAIIVIDRSFHFLDERKSILRWVHGIFWNRIMLVEITKFGSLMNYFFRILIFNYNHTILVRIYNFSIYIFKNMLLAYRMLWVNVWSFLIWLLLNRIRKGIILIWLVQLCLDGIEGAIMLVRRVLEWLRTCLYVIKAIPSKLLKSWSVTLAFLIIQWWLFSLGNLIMIIHNRNCSC